MLVTRTSRLSGVEHTIDLPISAEELLEIEHRGNRPLNKTRGGAKLTDEQREFLISGMIPDEWLKHM